MTKRIEQEAAIAQIESANAQARRKTEAVVRMLGASPAEVQIRFLHKLLESPEEAKAFLDAPALYAAERGVVVHPALVRSIVDVAVFGEPISERLASDLGQDAVRALGELRGGQTVAAFPIAIATAVAVASAAVALVANASEALTAAQMKGLAPLNLPRGLASTTSAVIYATTAATSALVVTAAGANVAASSRPLRST